MLHIRKFNNIDEYNNYILGEVESNEEGVFLECYDYSIDTATEHPILLKFKMSLVGSETIDNVFYYKYLCTVDDGPQEPMYAYAERNYSIPGVYDDAVYTYYEIYEHEDPHFLRFDQLLPVKTNVIVNTGEESHSYIEPNVSLIVNTEQVYFNNRPLA